MNHGEYRQSIARQWIKKTFKDILLEARQNKDAYCKLLDNKISYLPKLNSNFVLKLDIDFDLGLFFKSDAHREVGVAFSDDMGEKDNVYVFSLNDTELAKVEEIRRGS